MSRTTQASFCVKPSHEFVDPSPMPQQVSEYEKKYSLDSELPVQYTQQDNRPKQGSGQGMAIRNTATSLEDYY